MRKLLSKVKSTIQDTQSHDHPSSPFHPSTIAPPTPTDLFRYRYHHGTNLGSIFVLEQWLFPSMFPSCLPSGSELDAVSTSLSQIGLEKTRERWEKHWRDAVSEKEFEWLVAEAKCTSIRLPIGYFTLGSQFCVGTPFEGVGGVYANSWSAVVEFVKKAREWGIGVLVDLHAVPGGANRETHSGTSSGKAHLWGSRKNLEHAKRCLTFIARELKGIEGVIGIQVCNEAVWDARGMFAWYEEIVKAIGEIDPSMPIYISDGWNLGKTLEWCNCRMVLKGGMPTNPLVVDTHRYYTFSEADRNQSPQQIVSRIPGELGELKGQEGSLSDRGEAQVIIGEWSCVLDGKTWGRVRPEEKDGLVQQFGQAQCRRWEDASGGSYFWTYKMEWMDGGEWGFAEQTKKGNVTPPSFQCIPTHEIGKRVQNANERRGEMKYVAARSHEEYWNHTCPGKQFEHHLYSEGWDVGFSDASKFFSMRADGVLGERARGEGGDKIGCLEVWVKKRILESGQRGEFVWEWEQGFRAGIAAFQQCAGISSQ